MTSEVKLLAIVIASIIIVGTGSTTVRNGAYHNVVIDVQSLVPTDDWLNFLLKLEVRFLFIAQNKNIRKFLKRFLSRREYFWENIIDGCVYDFLGD